VNRALRITAVTLATLGALAACSSGGNPSDGGGTTSPATATATGSQGTAPKVPAALPVNGITANPCTALADTQLQELGMASPGNQSSNPGGPSCQWNGAANPANAAYINVLTSNPNGLSDIYANNDEKKFAYFEPATVDGYPAVYASANDGRANGFCSLDVGVTDQLAVDVSVQLLQGVDKSQSCSSANKIATAMVQHLNGAA
jgi:hypothetical protein